MRESSLVCPQCGADLAKDAAWCWLCLVSMTKRPTPETAIGRSTSDSDGDSENSPLLGMDSRWRKGSVSLGTVAKIAIASVLAPFEGFGWWLLVRIVLTARNLPEGQQPSPALAFLFFSSVLLIVLPLTLLRAVWPLRHLR